MKDIIFSPTEISALSTQNLTVRRAAFNTGGLERGLVLYSPKLDLREADREGFLPSLPGDLISIIARPGHGKTAFMMRWARERASDIRMRAALGEQQAAKRVVVYVTYEQTIEAMNSFHIAANAELSITEMALGKITDEQWAKIEYVNTNRVADPLWFIGHSVERKAKRPLITSDELLKALVEIKNWQGEESFIIDSVFIDYLQRMPYDGHESKTVGTSENVTQIKNLALAISTPVVLGVQARRDVSERQDQMPTESDGEYTANIEQTSDGIMTLFRPGQAQDSGTTYNNIRVDGFQQMVIGFRKQKMGPANFSRWVNFDPRYNSMNDVELKHYNLREDEND